MKTVTSVPDDKLICSAWAFRRPSLAHVKNCFEHVHLLSEKAYHGNGIWADRDSEKLASLPASSRPLNIIDNKFPPLYRNTAWRMIGYACAYRVDAKEIYLERLLSGGKYLLREQQKDGSFLYWRGQEDGWPNSRHLLFCTANPACALIELYRLTGDEEYLNASSKAAEWLMNFETDNNNNYNSFAIWHLCEHYRETGDTRCLESAIEKTIKGVYHNQQPNGGWPGHNSWIFYHAIILRGFAFLYGLLPDGHKEKPELRRRIIMALNCIIAGQRKNGFLSSCYDESEWLKSRQAGNPYLVHKEEKICPFAIHALVSVQQFTDLDISNVLYGLLSAPEQDELVQGQEGMMHLAYGVAYEWMSAGKIKRG